LSPHCSYHDGLIEGQARIEQQVRDLTESVERLNRIIIGNGNEGLMSKMTRNSVLLGLGGGSASIIFAGMLKYFLGA
jgi:hypothetical protein